MKTLLTLIFCLFVFQAHAENVLKPYSGPTPDFQLTDLDGNSHSLADHRGKVLMVQFWATYCAPCIAEMPAMNELAKHLGEKFKILAINMGETEADVRRFVEKVNPDFTMLLDPDGRSIQDWKVFAVPSTFILDTKGDIRFTLYGPAEWNTPQMQTLMLSLTDQT